MTSHSERSSGKSARLHYLDWLQVLAILGVFLFHALHPFDDLVDFTVMIDFDIAVRCIAPGSVHGPLTGVQPLVHHRLYCADTYPGLL